VDVPFKQELYNHYKNDMKKHGNPVALSRFYELWSVLFPHTVNRPWCNVPGKCDTCYEIQKGRSDPRINIHIHKYKINI
jgi:hypothetical protein